MVLTWLRRGAWQFSSSRRPLRRHAAGGLSPRLEALEDRVLLSTFVVTNTNDSGDGSLRAAIQAVDSGPGGDTIAFNIGGGGVQTIQPTSALPMLSRSVTIDGTTQPGYDGSPLIVLNGSLFNGGSNGFGLDVFASNVTIRGLVIDGFTGSQIRMDAGSNSVIAGNYIGTDVTGTRAVTGAPGVSNMGIEVFTSNNTIGGVTDADRNLISGNSAFGVWVAGPLTTGNVVEGNYVGTDVSGTRALPNLIGVNVGGPGNTIGGTTAGARNIISGNVGDGLSIQGAGTVLQGNYIGTDATGTQAVGNGRGMEVFDSVNDVIGGTDPGAGNVVSGNRDMGIRLVVFLGTLNGLQLEGNYIGTDASGTTALGNATGILVSAPNVAIGGTTAGAGNVISGNTGNGVSIQAAGVSLLGNFIGTDVTGTHAVANQTGVAIDANGTNAVIGGTASGAGNLISGNQLYGISLSGATATHDLVEGNIIGTDINGTTALGNFAGVYLLNGAHGNTIGGTDAAASNLISGNRFYGINIAGASTSGNLIEGNVIGTDVSGATALGNVSGINDNGSNNTIGAAGAGNLISGNASEGVFINGSGDVVQGNYIGTDVTGTQAVANGYNGNGDGVIVFFTAANTTIGGAASGAGNVISGNQRFGVNISVANNTTVQGNYIGTDASGGVALGNGMEGIFAGGATNSQIGGTAAGAGNVISGNGGNGIEIISTTATGNRVQGNYIGTDATGTQALGNALDGVAVFTGSGNTIGGTASGSGNVIAGNGGSGVLISGISARSNVVQGNFIGTDVSGTINLGNAADGVTIQSGFNNTIGGTAAGAGNVIAFNGNDGVLVDTGSGNAILSDLIFANGNLGIELLHNGNNNQAAPVLTSAVQNPVNTVIQGTLQSTPNTTFTVQVFSDPSADPSGSAEGQQLLATVTVTTDASGFASFTVNARLVPLGQVVTATATDAGNNTSEFSDPVTVTVA